MSPNGMVHINMKIDPQHVVPESNDRNQSGLGPGYDEAGVQITPPQPANLVNTSIGINPSAPEWGGSITVTAQVSNEAYGAAPATREAVVLTPSGIAPGTVRRTSSLAIFPSRRYRPGRWSTSSRPSTCR